MTIHEATAISLRNVSKKFGDLTALAGISLDIGRGEMFGLIGPDGAGKTTLIRVICGLLKADGGELSVAGRDPRRAHWAIAERVGYFSQRFSLYGDLSIDENIAFFAEIHGVTDYLARRERLLDLTRLTPFRARRADRLSGGMKQKLALACTLVHEPEIILLDEPTTGVDPVSRREFWKLLSEFLASGLTIVMATPYLDEAERCDRLAILSEGKLVALGTPAELKREIGGDGEADTCNCIIHRTGQLLAQAPFNYAVPRLDQQATLEVEARALAVYQEAGLIKIAYKGEDTVALVLIGAMLAVATPSFLTTANLINVTRQISLNGILAVGVTFVLLTGGVDLSLGSVVALSGVVAASFAHPGDYPAAVAVLMGILAGMACGATNGLVITLGRVAPFIVTLGTFNIAFAITQLYSNAQTVTDLPPALTALGNTFALGGTQYGEQLRGYEEFSITPKGYLAISIPYQAARGVAGLLKNLAGDRAAGEFTLAIGQLNLPSLRVRSDETALLVIDPQSSFTAGEWMRSIGPAGEAETMPIRLAFENCARLLEVLYNRINVMFTRCPFPPGSYGWDERLEGVIDPEQPYFIKPSNNVLLPVDNGFREWVTTLIRGGIKTLVMGGCTLNSCLRVSAVETWNYFPGKDLAVIADLSLCGARTSNYLNSDLFQGMSPVESAIRQMSAAGVLIADSVEWVGK